MPRTPPRRLLAARRLAARRLAAWRLAARRLAARLLAALCCAALLAGGAGCGGPAPPAVTISGLRWIVSQASYDRIAAAAPGLAGELLAARELIIVRTPAARAGPVPDGAVPAELFRSYRDFAGQLRQGTIGAGVRVVVYDPESWPDTPRQERIDPMRYLALFARTATARGYRAVLAPGRDLTLTEGGACEKRRGERVGEAYVRCGIPRSAAGAPVFVIQAAPQELDLPALHRLVAASARQARAANPDVVVIATISTAPGGVPAGSAAMVRAAETMRPYVEGFMLNTTRATTPAALAFLRALPTGPP